jgi:hypothetical protein
VIFARAQLTYPARAGSSFKRLDEGVPERRELDEEERARRTHGASATLRWCRFG